MSSPRLDLRVLGITLLLLALLQLALAAQERPRVGSAAWREAKGRQILAVVADLRARERADLDDATRSIRLGLLDRLAAYARAGDFPVNDRWPTRPVPWFIDSGGRRCALAHLIEASGEEQLLLRLAREANNAYLAQIGDDEELLLWLARHGFTPEEVAYIQAPSIIDRPPVPPGGRPEGYFPIGGGRDGGRAGPPSGVTPGGIPPSQGPIAPPAVAGSGPTGGGGRRKTANSTIDLAGWWQLQRDLLVPIRPRYHAPRGVTGSDQGPGADAAMRPGPDELAAIEKAFAALRRDPALETAALMALTEAKRDDDGRARLAAEILTMLRRRNAQHRDYGILALGRTGAPEALEVLIAVLGDRPAGRKALGDSSRVPAAARAMAALALGQIEDEAAARALLDALAEGDLDLDSSCAAVVGLAQLARARVAPGEILPRLAALAGSEKAPAPLRNQAMAALGAAGDRSVLDLVLEPLRHFRGSVELRRAAARSVGALGGGLERTTFAVLSASAHRDPDAGTRQLAILAIGELAARDRDLGRAEPKERRELVAEVGRFLEDGVTGFFKQRSDRRYYAVAAGLAARAHEGHRRALAAALAELLAEGKRIEDRAAAALALGLSRSPEARGALRSALADPGAPLVAGYAAEGLGLLEDGDSSAALLALVTEDGDDFVAYEAALALGALGRTELQPKLLEALGQVRSESRRAALARALAQMGDRRSVGALLAIASDRGRNLELRLRAISALGLVLREADRPWSLPARLALDPSGAQPTPRLAAAIL